MTNYFDRPILIYSDYCIHSENFLKSLMRNDDIYNYFIRINIDVDKETKRRPDIFYKIQDELSNLKQQNIKITRVPTVITENGEYILSDKDAFEWLDFQLDNHQINNYQENFHNEDQGEIEIEDDIQENTQEDMQDNIEDEYKEVSGFCQNEMNSFSDNYSNFGSTDVNDAKEQTFKFFQNGQLTDDNYLNTDVSFEKGKNFVNGFLDEYEANMNKKIDFNTKQMEREVDTNFYQKQMDNNFGRMEFPKSNVSKKISSQEVNQKLTNRNNQIQNNQQKNPQNLQQINFSLQGKLSKKESDLNKKLEDLINERNRL